MFHHGAGSSGLSFAICAGLLRDNIQAGVIAFDVRYHGATDVGEGEPWKLQLDVLARDEVDVVNGVAERERWLEGEWPDLILVGHRFSIRVAFHFSSHLDKSSCLGSPVALFYTIANSQFGRCGFRPPCFPQSLANPLLMYNRCS